MPSGGQIQNFSQLISTNARYVVPDFQRNFSWEIKQVDELLKDIVTTTLNQDSHFLGGVIFYRPPVSDHSEPFEVVDGQQRLTTLFLLISVIRDLSVGLPVGEVSTDGDQPLNPVFDAQALLFISSEAGNISRFVAHPMIAGLAETSVFAYPNVNRPKLPSRHYKYSLPLRKAHKYLTDQLKDSLANLTDDESRVKYLHRLLETIKYKLKILNVSSDSNYEAYEIFMTLNSRGMPLGPSDLVKSEIFKHLTRDLSGQELDARNAALTDEWKQILSNLEDGDVDQFLRHYLVSTSRVSITSKKIFERMAHFINHEGVSAADQSRNLLNELSISSKLYRFLLENDSPEIVGEEPSLQLMQEIIDSYRIFCLAAIDPRIPLKESERVELIRLCEVAVIRWTLTDQNAQVLENSLQTLSMNLREGAAFEDLAHGFRVLIAPDDRVERAFKDPIEKTNLVRIVLHRINRRWDANDLVRFDTSKIHVEHIAPDASTDHWMDVLFPDDSSGADRKVEYEAATELWGNKTILDAKLNQELKQKSFAEKRTGSIERLNNGKEKVYKGYTDSPLEVTRDLGTNLTEWNRLLIEQRTQWIFECFLKIWSVDSDTKAIKPFSAWLAEQK